MTESPDQTTELQAAVYRRLVAHLGKRTDVQNIDLMILAGFCRNCLSDWYEEAAKERGIDMDKDEAREKVYGMSYQTWKSRYQKPATEAQIEAFNRAKPDRNQSQAPGQATDVDLESH